MIKDAFIKLDPVKAAHVIEMIGPALDAKFDVSNSSVMVQNLSFYEGYFLAEISRHDQHPPIVRHAVCSDEGAVHLLDWSNGPIYALNKSVPLTLNEETMTDYVRFFFTHVRGSHGRFLIIDTVDDIDWREEPAAAGRKALGKMIEPLHVKAREPDGTVVFVASIIFKDSLFLADAYLKPDGSLSMQNEELLVEDIPVADDLFGQ